MGVDQLRNTVAPCGVWSVTLKLPHPNLHNDKPNEMESFEDTEFKLSRCITRSTARLTTVTSHKSSRNTRNVVEKYKIKYDIIRCFHSWVLCFLFYYFLLACYYTELAHMIVMLMFVLFFFPLSTDSNWTLKYNLVTWCNYELYQHSKVCLGF